MGARIKYKFIFGNKTDSHIKILIPESSIGKYNHTYDLIVYSQVRTNQYGTVFKFVNNNYFTFKITTVVNEDKQFYFISTNILDVCHF